MWIHRRWRTRECGASPIARSRTAPEIQYRRNIMYLTGRSASTAAVSSPSYLVRSHLGRILDDDGPQVRSTEYVLDISHVLGFNSVKSPAGTLMTYRVPEVSVILERAPQCSSAFPVPGLGAFAHGTEYGVRSTCDRSNSPCIAVRSGKQLCSQYLDSLCEVCALATADGSLSEL
jgi:hypothetical protein